MVAHSHGGVARVAKTYFPVHNRTVGVFIPADNPQRMEIPAVASIVDDLFRRKSYG